MKKQIFQKEEKEFLEQKIQTQNKFQKKKTEKINEKGIIWNLVIIANLNFIRTNYTSPMHGDGIYIQF